MLLKLVKPEIKQFEEFGLKGKIQVVDTAPGITDLSLLPSSGPSALGMYVAQPYVYTIDTPTNQQFVQAFRTRYGRDPGISAEATYVARRMAFWAPSRPGCRGGCTGRQSCDAVVPVHSLTPCHGAMHNPPI